MIDIGSEGGIGVQTYSEQEEALRSTYLAAYDRWYRLELEPDCWIDAGKRQAMLAARISYQDAKLACVRIRNGV